MLVRVYLAAAEYYSDPQHLDTSLEGALYVVDDEITSATTKRWKGGLASFFRK